MLGRNLPVVWKKWLVVSALAMSAVILWPGDALADQCPWQGPDQVGLCENACDYQFSSCSYYCTSYEEPDRSFCQDQCWDQYMECFDWCLLVCPPIP